MNNTTHHSVRLTAGEVSSLWSQYQNDTLAICVLSYFKAQVEDADIRPVIEYALHKSQEHVAAIRQIFRSDAFPIPIGFTDADVNANAPRLFTDVFIAKYLRHMAVIGMAGGTLALGLCARSDISLLFRTIIAEAVELHEKVRVIKLAKGIYIRPPAVSPSDKTEFVNRQRFLSGFFGEKRSLTAIEAAHLFSNSQTNALGKAMMMGFAQVATTPAVKEYMQRGKAIAGKHIRLFNEILLQEDIPASATWDAEVTDSTIAPFSEKLIMFHAGMMIAAGLGNYAASVAVSQRSDIWILYARLMPEIGLFGEDGMNIMIDNQWMEEPPQMANRNALAERNRQ